MSLFSKSFPISNGSRVFQLEEDGKFKVYDVLTSQGNNVTLVMHSSSVKAAVLFHEQSTAVLKELQETMPHLYPTEPGNEPVLRKISIP